MIEKNSAANYLLSAAFLLCLAFVTYASLANGSNNGDIHGKTIYWFGIFRAPFSRDFNSFTISKDIAVNLIFYLPLGMTAALAFIRNKPGYFSKLLFSGFFISLVLETIQFYVGRQADSMDIAMNTIGFILGFEIIVFTMRRYKLHTFEIIGFLSEGSLDRKTNIWLAIRWIYVFTYILFALSPYDINVHPKYFYYQLFESGSTGFSMIILDPFFHFKNGSWLSAQSALQFLGYVPLAILTALVGLKKQKLSCWHLVFYCLIFSLVIEISQVFIMSRQSDVYNILLAAVAGLLCWYSVKWWKGNTQDFEISKHEAHTFLLGYTFFLCLMAWAPYQFEMSPQAAVLKIANNSNFVPFKNHIAYPSIGNIIDLAKELSIFIPFGFFLSAILKSIHKNSRFIWAAAFSCFLFSAFLELSQSICIGRYVDITDCIMAIFGGVLGAFLGRLKYRTHGYRKMT